MAHVRFRMESHTGGPSLVSSVWNRRYRATGNLSKNGHSSTGHHRQVKTLFCLHLSYRMQIFSGKECQTTINLLNVIHSSLSARTSPLLTSCLSLRPINQKHRHSSQKHSLSLWQRVIVFDLVDSRLRNREENEKMRSRLSSSLTSWRGEEGYSLELSRMFEKDLWWIIGNHDTDE